MKRIVLFIFAVMCIFMLAVVPCAAEEAVLDTGADAEVAAEEETVFTRLWEWFLENKEAVVALGGEFLTLFILSKFYGPQKGWKDTLQSISTSSSSTNAGQGAVLEKMNEMIGGFNEYKALTEKLEAAESHIETLTGTTREMMASLFEMMTMIHTQNRNISQGTKDRITQLYADCMKKIGIEAPKNTTEEKSNDNKKESTDT